MAWPSSGATPDLPRCSHRRQLSLRPSPPRGRLTPEGRAGMVRPAAEALRRPWRAAALRRTCHGRALAAGKSTGNRFIKGTLQPPPSHGLCSLRPLGERADNKVSSLSMDAACSRATRSYSRAIRSAGPGHCHCWWGYAAVRDAGRRVAIHGHGGDG